MLRKISRQKRFWLTSLLFLLLSAVAFPSFAQEGENYCRTAIAQTIEYGETMTGLIDESVPFAFFCFEGERGDNVTASVQATSQRLIPVVLITDPVFSEEDLQNPLGAGVANNIGGSAEATASLDSSETYLIVVLGDQNTLGSFEITIDAEGQSIFGGGGLSTEDEPTEEPSNSGEGNNSSGDPLSIIPGETNICRLDGVDMLAYGDSLTRDLDASIVLEFFCFEGKAGDFISVEAGTESGDLVMAVVIADPFFDGTQDTVFAADVATSRSDSATIEYEVPTDGNYVVAVQMVEGESGAYFLEINGEAGVVYDCSTEPLSILTSSQWGLPVAEGDIQQVAINVDCGGALALSVMGAPEVIPYDIDRDGNLVFIFGNRLFTTSSVSAEEWLLTSEDGTSYTLAPINEESCTEAPISDLIKGVWEFPASETVFLSFTCNGLVIISLDTEAFAQNYTVVDGTITIPLGPDTELILEEAVITDSLISATLDGSPIELNNSLAGGNP